MKTSAPLAKSFVDQVRALDVLAWQPLVSKYSSYEDFVEDASDDDMKLFRQLRNVDVMSGDAVVRKIFGSGSRSLLSLRK